MDVEIRCINKTPRNDPHDRIHRIGGTNSDGTPWRLSQQEAIAGIETGKWSFYVRGGGRTVRVIVALHHGHKYIKTENDGIQPDNLLALPECT